MGDINLNTSNFNNKEVTLEECKKIGNDLEDVAINKKTENSMLVDPKYSKRKNPPPLGMTLSAYKRQLRREKLEEKKEEWNLKKKEKRREKQLAKRRLNQEKNDLDEECNNTKKRLMVRHHVELDVIIDCGFDEMMKPEVSLISYY